MESDNKYNFTFPLLAHKGNILHFARNIDEITTCSVRGLKSEFYKNLNIIDSAGKAYRVKNAIKVGYSGYFWGFNLLKGQRIKIDLEISNIDDCPVEVLKDKILKAFRKDEYFWDSDGEIETKRAYIEQAKKHVDILKYLSDHFYAEI